MKKVLWDFNWDQFFLDQINAVMTNWFQQKKNWSRRRDDTFYSLVEVMVDGEFMRDLRVGIFHSKPKKKYIHDFHSFIDIFIKKVIKTKITQKSQI